MISLFAIALAFAGAQEAMPASAGFDGVWTNPGGSVQVRTGPCGDALCGWVVWASQKAQADAARKSGGPLIGTKLLRGYRASGPMRWNGEVYVPDMGSSFGSTIALVDGQTLRIKGCVLGGLVCRTQDWHRVQLGGTMAAR